MILKTIRDEDYSCYREVSMLLAFPHCNFKCCVELGRSVSMCQNAPVARAPDVEYAIEDIYERYTRNVITHSIVCAGLEPFDSFEDVLAVISYFRQRECADPFIIYTGYAAAEVSDYIMALQKYPEIIVKFGRYIPAQPSHFDQILGVQLASPNQYAVKIS